MGDKTGISWTDATWNPTKGCEQVSPGCRNCYAKHQAARIVRMSKGKPSQYDGLVKLGPNGDPCWTGAGLFDAETLALPLRWTKPRRIFVDSMSDLFFDAFTNEQIAAVFGVMAACPQHTFQVLTKRARRMREWFAWLDAACLKIAEPAHPWWRVLHCLAAAGNAMPGANDDGAPLPGGAGATWPLPNVWLGVSVENQAAADERIPGLLATPAAVRFLSCEPLLGPLDLRHVQHDRMFEVDALTGDHGVTRPLAGSGPRIDWVIAGCESGPGARPCDVAWLRSLRDQCAAADVPFFLKQASAEIESARTPDGPDQIVAGPGSKRKAGGVIELPYLDGVQHTAMPKGTP